jgi:ankyrin repeat protein
MRPVHTSQPTYRITPPPRPQESVKLLLAHGAQVGAAAMDDMNAIHFAAQKGHVEALRALINAGATTNSKTRKGGSDWRAGGWCNVQLQTRLLP